MSKIVKALISGGAMVIAICVFEVMNILSDLPKIDISLEDTR